MITTALSISLIVLFVHATSWDGMINDWIKNYIDPNSKLSNPVYDCPICMTPYYGFILIIIMHIFGVTMYSFIEYFLILGIASGFSTIWAIISKIEENLRKNDEA